MLRLSRLLSAKSSLIWLLIWTFLANRITIDTLTVHQWSHLRGRDASCLLLIVVKNSF